MYLYESTNGGAFVYTRLWTFSPVNNVTRTQYWTRTPVDGNSYRYRIYAYDAAGNLTLYTNPGTITFDTTPPSTPTISGAPNHFHDVWSNNNDPVLSISPP